MTEIKKTLAILKARWPEVTLIIGIEVLAVLSNILMRTQKSDLAPALILPFLIFGIALVIVYSILSLGFLRTTYLESEKPQTPAVLLKVGKLFFWRMFKWGLLYIPIYCILVWLTFLVTRQFISIDTGFFETAKSFPLVYQFYFTVPTLILMKPLLIMPALIIVLNCQVLQSFKYLAKCRLFDAKRLLVLFLTSIIFTFSWVLLPTPNAATPALCYVWRAVHAIVGNFIGLMIAVMAVRFVASLDLVYDEQQSSENLDFEDLRKYSDRNLKE